MLVWDRLRVKIEEFDNHEFTTDLYQVDIIKGKCSLTEQEAL